MKLRNLVSTIIDGSGRPAAFARIAVEHVRGSFTDIHTVPGQSLPAIVCDEEGAFSYPIWPNQLGLQPSFYRLTILGKRVRIWVPDGDGDVELSLCRQLATGDNATVLAQNFAWLSYIADAEPPPEELPPNTLYIQVDPIE